jgi:2-succinyl-5-enolpyruvyl-6-hydroxy-3-cyclohexene-1-carboxylate synthase
MNMTRTRKNAWPAAVETVSRCLEAGVRDYVVCGGARNAPLLEALARAGSSVKLWRHFEERSAGFFALGRTMATGEPCAVVTTSGTAAANLLPALIEAQYQARPVVAITADRPEAFRGSGAPQCIEQPGMFGVHAATDGFAAWDGTRPLHLNIELDEAFEIADFACPVPAAFSPAKPRLDVARLARWLREDRYRGLVVLLGGLEETDHEEVYHFCRELNVPVVADATSGLREALDPLALHGAGRLLREKPPGKVLRLGEVPCGRFWRDLEDLEKVSVWSVCRNGLPGLARESEVTCGAVHRVIKALGDIEPGDDATDLLVHDGKRTARIEELLETYPDSEPALLRAVSQFACLGTSLFLGNSLPIREWNEFAQRSRPTRLVRANRGANGIDGQISTWLGASATETDAWAVIGDLTALYDLAAPFVLDQIQPNGRVLVVINNHGGRIFSRLPRLAAMSDAAQTAMLSPHQADLGGFAKLWNMAHHTIRQPDDLDSFEPAETTTMLEIQPNESQTQRFWQDWDRI